MRSSPTGNNTLLRIQQEISEVAARENELRSTHGVVNNNGVTTNGVSDTDRSPSPVSPPPVLMRAVSTSALNTSSPAVLNGFTTSTTRRFIPNNNTKGVMHKFFKSRGKIATVQAMTGGAGNNVAPRPAMAWQPAEVISSPAKALIPTDKPLRKGYVPVEERIQKELKEMKNREEELRTIRRKSQPDLMAALEAASEHENDSIPSSGTSSPLPYPGRLRHSRSYSQLLDDDMPEDTVSAPPSLRPARSLAELCEAADEEIESPRSLIQRWESRIKETQEAQM